MVRKTSQIPLMPEEKNVINIIIHIHHIPMNYVFLQNNNCIDSHLSIKLCPKHCKSITVSAYDIFSCRNHVKSFKFAITKYCFKLHTR